MTTTYVAWNGQSYPWPPPEGWYEAADGQWWAPGTGPNPPPEGEQPAPNGTSGPPHEHDTVLGQRSQDAPDRDIDDDTDGSSDEARAVGGDRPTADAAAGRETTDAGGSTEGYETTDTGHETTEGYESTTDHETTEGLGPLPSDSARYEAEADGGETRSRSLPPTPVLAGAGIAVVLLAVIAIVALTGEDDEAVGPTPSTTSSTTEAADTSTPTPTQPEITPSSSVPTTRSEAEMVADFRSLLDENGLSGAQLTDPDIAEFGTAFCVFATIAQDSAEFDEFRQEALLDTGSELTEEELAIAIDSAVESFCPDEAVRLGLNR